jgi:uncharacterized protein (TIRG00374 family)
VAFSAAAPAMKRFIRRLVIAMLLGVAVYGVIALWTGYEKISDSLARFHWSAFAFALSLATLNYGLRFLKWEYYLARLQIRGIPKLESFLIFLSGFVLTVTPGKVGEVFKSAVLAETHGVAAARTAPIVVAERLTDVIGVVLLIVIGSLGFSGGLLLAGAGTFGVALGLVFVLWEAPRERFLRFAENRPGRLSKLAPKLREGFESLTIVASPAALLIPALLSLIGWGCEGIALWLLIQGFGVAVSWELAVFTYATATLAGAIIPVPGGLGVAEAMIQRQLVGLGRVDNGAATSAMILIRFATLWWAVLVGFGALALLRKRYPDLLRGESDAEIK